MQTNTGRSNGTAVPLGFPRHVVAPIPTTSTGPTPLPKRPKGRWFFGLLLTAIVAFAGYQVWNTFFRYQAFGTVDGRVLQVSPTFDGVVQYVHVREGEQVRQGQTLFTIDSVELRQRHDQLSHELQIASATLESEAAKLRWQSSVTFNQSQRAVAEYYEAAGKLVREQATLEGVSADLERTRSLLQDKAVSYREFEQMEINLRGQKQTVEKLKESLVESKKRSDQTSVLVNKADNSKEGEGISEAGSVQLKPHVAKIQAALAELTWLRTRLEQAQVPAPVNGVVVKLQRFAGEYCKAADILLSILEEGSLQTVLYMPQQASTTVKVGDEMDLVVEPYPETVRCKVIRLGDSYQTAPNNIDRQYAAKEKLLPIYLQPSSEASRWMALRVGEVVKLPR